MRCEPRLGAFVSCRHRWARMAPCLEAPIPCDLLVALVSVVVAMNMPEYGRSIIYGDVILVLLLIDGRQEVEQ